jgi:hypothetical protein
MQSKNKNVLWVICLFCLIIFSCEAENCIECKTKVFEPGHPAVITTTLECGDIQEGYIYDSSGGLRIVSCEKK